MQRTSLTDMAQASSRPGTRPRRVWMTLAVASIALASGCSSSDGASADADAPAAPELNAEAEASTSSTDLPAKLRAKLKSVAVEAGEADPSDAWLDCVVAGMQKIYSTDEQALLVSAQGADFTGTEDQGKLFDAVLRDCPAA